MTRRNMADYNRGDCRVPGCFDHAEVRGVCMRHYDRLRQKSEGWMWVEQHATSGRPDKRSAPPPITPENYEWMCTCPDWHPVLDLGECSHCHRLIWDLRMRCTPA